MQTALQVQPLVSAVCSSSCVARGEECVQSALLKTGARMRLRHINTRTWLDSHHFLSLLLWNPTRRRAMPCLVFFFFFSSSS